MYFPVDINLCKTCDPPELSCKSYEWNKRGGGKIDTQCIIIYCYCNLSNLVQGSLVTLSLFKGPNLPNSSVIIDSYGNLLNFELKIGTFHMYVISQ